MKKSMINLVAYAVASAAFAAEMPTYEDATNRIAMAFVPAGRLRVMDEKKVRDVMSLPNMMHKDVRCSLESNICWRLIDFPTSLESDQALFWIWNQKRSLCSKLATFDYWRTNRTALLRFADHLGSHVNVSTNSFLYEYMIASIDDEMELEMERAVCKLQGRPFMPSPVKPGRNFLRVKCRQQCAKIWNTHLPNYRKDMIIVVSRRIKEYLDIISPEERRRFMEEFASRAKLSNEEKNLAFGDYAK